MPKSIQQRVRAAIAKREKDAKAAEYKAGESARRSHSARVAAEVRKENRMDAVLSGKADPRTRAEFDALDMAEFGEF
jgi:hypothetical protein